MTTVRESLLFFRIQNMTQFEVRAWVKPDDPPQAWKLRMFIHAQVMMSPRELADLIAQNFPYYVNAVEVKDPNTRDAELVYNDWP